ncbi:Serine/threonine protein phosphatase 2A 57 kDa regulatory subunit B' beta isoform, partial [Reticulomyxa filosa]
MARAAKRQNLIELSEYISQSKQFSDDVMPYVMDMLSKNLFRSLPPPMFADFDPDEDEPCTDPSWPHVQLVYDFLHKFVLSVDVKAIKKYLDKKFLLNLIDLFNSEDVHERDYLKMILHRIYGRCMPARTFIRQTINNVLFEVIYNCRIHHGISELLEILGSIINGFALPLKKEHVLFLQQVLIPLHKTPTLPQFHQQLTYCVTQFIQKDSALAAFVLHGILKYWPATSCQKEVLFLQELEEVLQFTERSQIEKIV